MKDIRDMAEEATHAFVMPPEYQARIDAQVKQGHDAVAAIFAAAAASAQRSGNSIEPESRAASSSSSVENSSAAAAEATEEGANTAAPQQGAPTTPTRTAPATLAIPAMQATDMTPRTDAAYVRYEDAVKTMMGSTDVQSRVWKTEAEVEDIIEALTMWKWTPRDRDPHPLDLYTRKEKQKQVRDKHQSKVRAEILAY